MVFFMRKITVRIFVDYSFSEIYLGYFENNLQSQLKNGAIYRFLQHRFGLTSKLSIL